VQHVFSICVDLRNLRLNSHLLIPQAIQTRHWISNARAEVDGTQTDTLPSGPSGCAGGGTRNSQAEKPWVIFFYPYLKNRNAAFCPSDRTPRSRFLATDLNGYNGGITSTSQTPPPNSEQAIA